MRAVHCCRGWEKLPSRMTAPRRAAPGPAFFCASCRMRSLLETSQPNAKRKSGTCAGRSRKDQLAPAPQRGPRGRHPGVSTSSSGGMFHLLLRGERRDRAVARKPALSRCTSPPDVLGAAPASPRHGAMPPALRCRTRPAQHVPRLARLVSEEVFDTAFVTSVGRCSRRLVPSLLHNSWPEEPCKVFFPI